MQKDFILFTDAIKQYWPSTKSTWYFLMLAYAIVSLITLFIPTHLYHPSTSLLLPLVIYPFKLHPVGPFSLILFLGLMLFISQRHRFQGDFQTILTQLLPLFVLWMALILLEQILPISTLIAILMEVLILSFFQQELKYRFNDAILFKIVCYLIFIPNAIVVFWMYLKGNHRAIHEYWPGLVALHKGLILIVINKYKNSYLPVINTPGKHLSYFLLAFCVFELFFEPMPTGILSFLGFAVAAILESTNNRLWPINLKAIQAKIF